MMWRGSNYAGTRTGGQAIQAYTEGVTYAMQHCLSWVCCPSCCCHPPSRWLYTPYAASSTLSSLSSFTAMVDPKLVTASPTWLTPAATKAAMLSVVPPHTMQLRGRPVRLAAAAVTAATGAEGATTVLGNSSAYSCGWLMNRGCR